MRTEPNGGPHVHRCMRCGEEFACESPGLCRARYDVLPNVVTQDPITGAVSIREHCTPALAATPSLGEGGSRPTVLTEGSRWQEPDGRLSVWSQGVTFTLGADGSVELSASCRWLRPEQMRALASIGGAHP